MVTLTELYDLTIIVTVGEKCLMDLKITDQWLLIMGRHQTTMTLFSVGAGPMIGYWHNPVICLSVRL